MSQDQVVTVADGLTWTDIAPSFLRYAGVARKNGPLFHRLWRQLQLASEKNVQVMEPKTNIAIVGQENVGKSVLSLALQARVREHSFELPDASTDAERDLITIGKWSNVVSTLPGQESGEKDDWLRKCFDGNGRMRGVVFVASWGYTKPRSKAVQRQLAAEVKTMQALRNRMMQQEAVEFRDVCRRIRSTYQQTNNPLWLIVAVSKADLYFQDDKLADAEAFYSLEVEPEPVAGLKDTPSFYSIFQEEVASRVGTDHVKAHSLPVSSYVDNFHWLDEEIKGSISDRDRSALINHFIATMNALSPE